MCGIAGEERPVNRMIAWIVWVTGVCLVKRIHNKNSAAVRRLLSAVLTSDSIRVIRIVRT